MRHAQRYPHPQFEGTDKPQKHFDGGGLHLLIPTTGSKLWRMAYRFDGKSDSTSEEKPLGMPNIRIAKGPQNTYVF